MKKALILALSLLAPAAWAEVGKIAALDGDATRTPEGGGAQPLSVGAAIELHDVISVGEGHLKFELNDGSVIMLAPHSVLEIREAEFAGQERRSFSGFLKAGALWTKVKKALGGEKFEVSTERAVAGVRGTIFRIDADALVKAASVDKRASIVRVIEGAVQVQAKKLVMGQVKPRATGSGERHEVAGPEEISRDKYEEVLVMLMANQQVVVGADIYEQGKISEAAKKDAFSKWINAHR